MINSLWIAKTGMEAQQMQLDVISNNLANVSTTGFKKVRAEFEDLMYQNLRQVGSASSESTALPTGLQVGLGVRTAATSRDFAQGALQQTNNPLDVAINGSGFFQIQLPDGTIGYTRDGSFGTNANREVVTSSGYPLIPSIQVPAVITGPITVSGTGIVSMGGTQFGQVELADFVNAAGLDPRGQNLFTETTASGPPIKGNPGFNGLGTLKHGFLENSNVNIVQELVTMIATQRSYEMNSKAIQTSDQMLQKLGQL